MIHSVTTITAQTNSIFENPVGALQASKRRTGGEADKAATGVKGLTPEQQRQVNQLKQIDQKVRTHEQAHLSVGADLVRGGASYTYETGPDNKRYAVAGEVSIDTSPARTPEDTIPKAQHIRATALAPAEPSPQDHSVAAQATRMENAARMEVAVKQREATTTPSTEKATSLYSRVESNNSELGQIGVFLNAFA